MKERFIDALTEAVVSVEYERYHPTMALSLTHTDVLTRKDKAIDMFRSDPMFHARVSSIVSYVLFLTDKYCDYKES